MSWWLNDYNSTLTSNVTFGGVAENATNGTSPMTHKVVESQNTQWTLAMSQVQADGKSINSTAEYAVPDIGQAGILMVQKDYLSLLPKLESVLSSNFTCNVSLTDFCYSDIETCDRYLTKLPDLSFQLDNTLYTIPSSTYALSYSYSIAGFSFNQCYLALSYNPLSNQTYVLGLPFLRQFVGTFNFDEMTVSLGVNHYASAGTGFVEI